MKKIRVFILTGSFVFGGTERYLHNLLHNMDREGFECVIGCLEKKGPFRPPPCFETVEFAERYHNSALGTLTLLIRLWRFIRRSQFDVVYSTHFQTNIYLTLASIFIPRQVLLLGYRGINRIQGRFGRYAALMCSRAADIVLVNSMAAADIFREKIKVNPIKIRLVYNGIKYDSATGQNRWRSPSVNKTRIICTIGRLHHLKGHSVLIKAFKKVLSDFLSER